MIAVALHLAGDNQKVGRVAREAVNSRVITISPRPAHQPAKLRPVGRSADDFLAEYVPALASGRAQVAKLGGEVLRPRRDACVAVDHGWFPLFPPAHILHQKSHQKVQFDQHSRFDADMLTSATTHPMPVSVANVLG